MQPHQGTPQPATSTRHSFSLQNLKTKTVSLSTRVLAVLSPTESFPLLLIASLQTGQGKERVPQKHREEQCTRMLQTDLPQDYKSKEFSSQIFLLLSKCMGKLHLPITDDFSQESFPTYPLFAGHQADELLLHLSTTTDLVIAPRG